MNFSPIPADYLHYVDLQKITDSTRKSRKRIVERYLYFLRENSLCETNHTYKGFLCFMMTLSHLKASSYNTYIIHLKNFFLYAERFNQNPPVAHLIRLKRTRQWLPKNIPLYMTEDLFMPLPEEKNSGFYLRDQAILEFLFSTGVRSFEARAIRICDLSADLSECCVTKKSHQRTVYLGEPAIAALRAYLHQRGIEHTEDRYKNLLLFVSRTGRALDAVSLNSLIGRLSQKRIGYRITPGMIRHTFATEMLRATGRIRSVQKLLGHVSINNTARYSRLEFTNKLRTVQQFHPCSNGKQIVDVTE